MKQFCRVDEQWPLIGHVPDVHVDPDTSLMVTVNDIVPDDDNDDDDNDDDDDDNDDGDDDDDDNDDDYLLALVMLC